MDQSGVFGVIVYGDGIYFKELNSEGGVEVTGNFSDAYKFFTVDCHEENVRKLAEKTHGSLVLYDYKLHISVSQMNLGGGHSTQYPDVVVNLIHAMDSLKLHDLQRVLFHMENAIKHYTVNLLNKWEVVALPEGDVDKLLATLAEICDDPDLRYNCEYCYDEYIAAKSPLMQVTVLVQALLTLSANTKYTDDELRMRIAQFMSIYDENSPCYWA